jgi:hypothetical protein
MAGKERITYENIAARGGRVGYEETVEIEQAEQVQNYEVERDTQILKAKLFANRQYLELQKDWAAHIRVQIWAVLIFQFAFVFLIGFNIGGFTDNINKIEYLFVGVILQNLANIIALGLVVARFLFPQKNDANDL